MRIKLCWCHAQFFFSWYVTHRIDDDQQPIICPRPQFHATVLQVKWEMEHDNLTVTLKDGWRVPCDRPIALQQDFSFMDDGKVTISAKEEGGRQEERRGSVWQEKWNVYGHWIRQRHRECLLVIEHQVWFPYVCWRDSDLPDASVLLRIPLQVYIYPFLQWKIQKLANMLIKQSLSCFVSSSGLFSNFKKMSHNTIQAEQE